MSGLAAALKALLIVIFFFLATIWLPDAVVKIEAVNRASAATQNTVAALVWLVGFAGGIWLLVRAQRRGFI